MARLKKRKDGRYQRKVTLSNGKQKFVYGKTIAEVNAAANALMNQDTAGLDEKNDKLYLTAEDYRAAQENQPQPEPEKAPEQAGEVPLNLETTRRFAQVLEKEQELMEDERAVEELQHMQKTTESICAWLEAHPESLPKARRFAEYYIPTTLKLLHTYNDVQGQQGENAETIRRDIAGILHTLNQAYDTLYDTLLSDVAMDVSSEIAALQGMLANDGLTGGNFE